MSVDLEVEVEVRGHASEAHRLERLWSGTFGDAYVERNRAAGAGRDGIWAPLFQKYPVARVLEVGCNVGQNLRWLAAHVPPHEVYGVDVNRGALEEVRRTVPAVNALWSPARALPFRDGWFDLAFTTGVLIHQPPATLPLVMAEIVRCSRRYILCGEYAAGTPTEVSYRGETGALFKRDFGAYYRELFPNLRLLEQGFLPRSEGVWDDVTYWLFEKE
jgi:spore coat polysaccharide biosynthesis protein SpsF